MGEVEQEEEGEGEETRNSRVRNLEEIIMSNNLHCT